VRAAGEVVEADVEVVDTEADEEVVDTEEAVVVMEVGAEEGDMVVTVMEAVVDTEVQLIHCFINNVKIFRRKICT
jgi:hypothetical protein